MIRPGQPGDWDGLVDVYDSSKPDELRRAGIKADLLSLRDDQTAQEDLKRVQVVVFETAERRIAGFGGYSGDYLGWLFVHKDHRRQGIARQLLRAILAQMPPAVWLWLLQGNDPAYGLYTSEGFKTVGGARLKLYGQECLALKLARERRRP